MTSFDVGVIFLANKNLVSKNLVSKKSCINVANDTSHTVLHIVGPA